MDTIQPIEDNFRKLFNATPLIIRAPGRINLIGEHTDYNQGWVLPAAIDKSINLAIGKRPGKGISLYSLDYNEQYEATLDNVRPSGKLWPDYILGVVEQFQKKGHQLEGFNIVFGGDIHLGAGLSSSEIGGESCRESVCRCV